MSNIYGHVGDLGDCLAACPAIRQLGGGEYLLVHYNGNHGAREPMTQSRADFIIPLLEAQPYITKARFCENHNEAITHDFSFIRRQLKGTHGESLSHWHSRHAGIDPKTIDESPWLKADPSPETAGKVVMARSVRYHNNRFPWREHVTQYKANSIFIGLPNEHAAFVMRFGFVPHRPVKDALEMAQLIAGSDLLICNQSLPTWIGLGLGVNMIQETWKTCMNSRIDRPNHKYIS